MHADHWLHCTRRGAVRDAPDTAMPMSGRYQDVARGPDVGRGYGRGNDNSTGSKLMTNGEPPLTTTLVAAAFEV